MTTPPEPDQAVRAKPRTTWAKRGPQLPRDSAERQGSITTLAFRLLGGRDQAIAFLNEPDATLGGRPLDVATSDAEGYQRVAQALQARAATAG